MKSLHRTKTIAAYEGARMAIKAGMPYPSYMLLKEAARGVMSYIVEDSLDKEISEKTKLVRLLDLVKPGAMTDEQIDCVQTLVNAEKAGLVGILSMDMTELTQVKRAIKKLIVDYFKEPI